jgi:hypothetical protein
MAQVNCVRRSDLECNSVMSCLLNIRSVRKERVQLLTRLLAVPELKQLVAGVRAEHVGVCGGQNGIGVGFLRILEFPLPIIIPPISPST